MAAWRYEISLLVLKKYFNTRREISYLWAEKQHSYMKKDPSSKNPHFQNEAKCRILLGEMTFSCMRIRNQLLCT